LRKRRRRRRRRRNLKAVLLGTMLVQRGKTP
jgi:hypothetical protein